MTDPLDMRGLRAGFEPTEDPATARAPRFALTAYGLIGIGPLTAGLATVAGLALTRHGRRTAPDHLQDHHLFQLRTAAGSLAGLLAGGLVGGVAAAPGWLLLAVTAGWTAARCARGARLLRAGRPHPRPLTLGA